MNKNARLEHNMFDNFTTRANTSIKVGHAKKIFFILYPCYSFEVLWLKESTKLKFKILFGLDVFRQIQCARRLRRSLSSGPPG